MPEARDQSTFVGYDLPLIEQPSRLLDRMTDAVWTRFAEREIHTENRERRCSQLVYVVLLIVGLAIGNDNAKRRPLPILDTPSRQSQRVGEGSASTGLSGQEAV